MYSGKSAVWIFILFATRIHWECNSLSAFLLIIGVVRVSFPRAHENSGSVGGARFEQPPEGVREPPETSLLGGGPPKGGFQTIPFSWLPKNPWVVDRLTGHISRILAGRVVPASQEALRVVSQVPSYAPNTP